MFNSKSRAELIDNQIYDLKFMSKKLNRDATGHKKHQLEYHKKAKKALVHGDERTACTYVKQSNQFSDLAHQSTTLACNLEVIGARILCAVQSGRINDQLLQSVSTLTAFLQPDTAIGKLGSMDKMFEDVLVYTGAVNDAMDDISAPEVGQDSKTHDVLSDIRDDIAADASHEFITLPTVGLGGKSRLNITSSDTAF